MSLDILRDSIGHPKKKLLSFDFARSFYSEFRASRYTTGPSDIRVKSYYGLNLLTASDFNFERLDILRDSIGHPSKKLLSFDFAQSFNSEFRSSRYITGFIRTSE